MDVEVIARPKTVYVAQDHGWPRWQFILAFANRSTEEWTLEECTLSPEPTRPGAASAGRSVLVGEAVRGERRMAAGGGCRVLVQEAEGGAEDASRLLLSYTLVGAEGARRKDTLVVSLVAREPLALDYPLDGRWSAANSRCDVHGVGVTFAMDFVVEEDLPLHLNQDPRMLQPEEFASFGHPLYAPIDGKVLAAVSDQPDLAVSPAGPSTFDQQIGKGQVTAAIVGNHVVIQGADGSCALLAHMKRGSALVKAGDTVIAGQQIGLVGNSGNSTGAHLHLEVLDGSPDLSDLRSVGQTLSGVPFGFVNARGAQTAPGANGLLVPAKLEIVERVGKRL